MVNLFLFSACFFSAVVWLILLLTPIRWRITEKWDAIDSSSMTLPQWPSLSIIVPARNESLSLPLTLPSWLNQDYPGSEIILIDDESSDGTSECARGIAEQYKRTIRIFRGTPLPSGWTGKLWALQQGVNASSGDMISK